MPKRDVLEPLAVLFIHALSRAFFCVVHGLCAWKILSSTVEDSTKAAFRALLLCVLAAYIAANLAQPCFAKLSTAHGLEEQRTCDVCNVLQAAETKHCTHCNRCVEGWDHHCVFIGQCVSRANHRVFWWYLFFQVLLIFPGLHTVVHHLGHGAWRKQLVWGLIGYFLLVSLVVIGYMLVSHTALACTGHTTHTWKQQQRAVKAVRANGVKTRLKDSRLTVSEMVGNFLWFLWSPQAYAVRVSMQRDGTSLGQRSLRYDGTCVGRVSRCVDTCCDNDFFSCC